MTTDDEDADESEVTLLKEHIAFLEFQIERLKQWERAATTDSVQLVIERDQAIGERDACHAVWNEYLKIMGYDPTKGHPMMRDAVRGLVDKVVTLESEITILTRHKIE